MLPAAIVRLEAKKASSPRLKLATGLARTHPKKQSRSVSKPLGGQVPATDVIEVKKSSAAYGDAPSNSAVLTYLSKLGEVPLLTREGEVELASRIERGEARVVRAIVESPVAVAELAVLLDDLAAGRLAPRDVTRNTSDE